MVYSALRTGCLGFHYGQSFKESNWGK